MEVRTRGLCFGYDEKRLLDDLHLAFPSGRISVILGRNGAGKTTLLKCIYGALTPQHGTVYLDDISAVKLTSREIACRIAVVRQEAHYIFPYNVRDVVLMGRTPHLNFLSAPRRSDMDIAQSALETVGLAHLATRRINELSSGEQQMVLLARALCQEPRILILDEANAHLDIFNQWHLLNLIVKLKQTRNLTVIAVIHRPEIAYWLADQVFILEKGRLLFQGPPQEVMTRENLSEVYGIPLETQAIGKEYQAVVPREIL